MIENRPRNTFPTLRSLLQPEALADAVRDAYPVDVVGCELLKPQLSDVYRIDSPQGPLILRVYPHSLNLSRWIDAEVRILHALYAGGVPVSLALPQKNGETLLPLDAPEGERYAVLFSYAHGRSLKRAKDVSSARAFGQVAAGMHAAGGGLTGKYARLPLDTYTLLVRPLEILGAEYPDREADLEELREAAQEAGEALERLHHRLPVWGFCHGDLNFSNVHVTAEGAFTIFNFEYCGPGWPAYDIATVMNFEQRDAARAFLEGYESVRPLLPEERAALGWLQIANKIWILGTAASLSNTFGSLLTSGWLFDQVLEFVRERMEAMERRVR